MAANRRQILAGAGLMLLVALATGPPAAADRPGPPQREHWSANGRYVLYLVDRWDARLELRLKRSAEEGGSLVLWSIPGPQPWRSSHPEIDGKPAVPATAHVTDDGRYVVLRDMWGRVGYDDVLVFLGPGGRKLASYTLEELLDDEEVRAALQTVSNRWWSNHGLFFLREAQGQFAFVTRLGTVRAFALATGGPVELSLAEEDAVLWEALLLARRYLESASPAERSTGAIQAALLGDREAVPALERLLDDREQPGVYVAGGGKPQRIHGVPLAAGWALAVLLGPDAVPLLERQLPGESAYMGQQWRELIEQAREGNLAPRYHAQPPPPPPEPPTESAAPPIWPWPVAAGLLALLAGLFANRRRTR